MEGTPLFLSSKPFTSFNPELHSLLQDHHHGLANFTQNPKIRGHGYTHSQSTLQIKLDKGFIQQHPDLRAGGDRRVLAITAGWPGAPAPGRLAYGGPAGLTPRPSVPRFDGELGPGPGVEGPRALPHTQSDTTYHGGSFP